MHDEDQWAACEALEAARLDAGLDLAALSAAGNAVTRARLAGRCPHTSAAGYSGGPRTEQQAGLKVGQLRCADWCGRIFASDEAWHEAMEEALHGSLPG